MLYINKDQKKKEGNNLTEEYLQNECRAADGHLSGIHYSDTAPHSHDSFSSLSNYKQRMVDVIMDNQSRYCCYCLRKINGAQIKTLEHIIPQSVTSANITTLNYYQRIPELSPTMVIPTDAFESQANQRRPPYPHEVSYNNMVASCDGTFPDILSSRGNPSGCCCNNKRGNDKAFPIYYLSNVGKLVEYTKEGEIHAVIGTPWYQEADDLITNTNLNHDSLTLIRKMWFKLRLLDFSEICQGNADKDKRRVLLYKALYPDNPKDYTISKMEEATRLSQKFEDDSQWETFMLYHQFYYIMKQLYP